MSKSAVGANYKGPSHKSTLGGAGPTTSGMSAGVEDGLSSRMNMDVNANAPKVSSDGSHAGFATERIEPRTTKSASKYGKTFQIER